MLTCKPAPFPVQAGEVSSLKFSSTARLRQRRDAGFPRFSSQITTAERPVSQGGAATGSDPRRAPTEARCRKPRPLAASISSSGVVLASSAPLRPGSTDPRQVRINAPGTSSISVGNGACSWLILGKWPTIRSLMHRTATPVNSGDCEIKTTYYQISGPSRGA